LNLKIKQNNLEKNEFVIYSAIGSQKKPNTSLRGKKQPSQAY